MSVEQLSDAELFAIAGIQPPAPQARDMSQPRNMRNNNPGNIEDGPFARSLPGYKGSDGRFAIFDSPQAGTDAKLRLLRSYGDRGFNTPREIIGRWAPASDGNDVEGYASFVSRRLGVNPDDALDMMDDATLQTLAGAIQEFEGGPAMQTAQAAQPAPDYSGYTDEELMRIAGLEAPQVDEITLTAARPGERERISIAGRPELGELQSELRPLPVFQPWKDLTEPIIAAGRELISDISDDYRARAIDPDTGQPRTDGRRAGFGEILGDALMLPVAIAEGVTRQVTGPVSRGLANAGLPVFERQKLADIGSGEAPRRLEGAEAADAILADLELALGGARSLPRFGPPRPPIGAVTRGERRVASAIDRTIARDQMTPQQVIQNLRTEPDLPAFQAGGENLRAMADVLAQVPGEANTLLRKAARDSQAKAPSRIRAEIGKTFDATGDYYATVDAMLEQRRAAAEPYREGAFNAPLNTKAFGEEIAPLMGRIPKKAIGYAREIARREGVNPDELGIEILDVPAPARVEQRPVKVMERGPLGEPVEVTRMQDVTVEGDMAPQEFIISRPTMKTLHYIKKGLDQELEQYRNPVSGRLEVGNGLGAATARLRSEFGSALRRSNPDYDAYMQIWGDESGQLEALQLGRDAFGSKANMSAETLRKRWESMSQAEQDNYRLGLGEALFDQVNRRGVQSARQLLKNEEFQARVRIAVPDETSFRDFMSALERQVQVQDRNTSIAGGSPTAYRQAARADLEQQGLGPADFVSGAADLIAGLPPRSMTAKGIRQIAKALPSRDRSLIGDPELNRLLGEALSDPETLERILEIARNRSQGRDDLSRALLQALPPLQALPGPEATPAR